MKKMRLLEYIRRHTRFTVRTLLALIAVICVWSAMNANQAYRQRSAVAVVFQLGGRAVYGFQETTDRNELLRLKVRQILFYCFCTPVVEVDLTGCNIVDSDLACLRNLADLKVVRLSGNRGVDGNGLQYIRHPEHVASLDLALTAMSDRTIAHILPFRSLRELSLSKTLVGDECVRSLGALERLEVLDLSSTRISDAAIRSLGQMERLADLNIAGTNVTDIGLKELEEHDSLQTLVLSAFTFSEGEPGKESCRVTDHGVAKFKLKAPRCKVRF